MKTVFLGDIAPGFPTLITAILFLGGLQLMALGVIGEYLGRLFIESKRRPLFLLDEYHASFGKVSPESVLVGTTSN